MCGFFNLSVKKVMFGTEYNPQMCLWCDCKTLLLAVVKSWSNPYIGCLVSDFLKTHKEKQLNNVFEKKKKKKLCVNLIYLANSQYIYILYKYHFTRWQFISFFVCCVGSSPIMCTDWKYTLSCGSHTINTSHCLWIYAPPKSHNKRDTKNIQKTRSTNHTWAYILFRNFRTQFDRVARRRKQNLSSTLALRLGESFIINLVETRESTRKEKRVRTVDGNAKVA